MGQAKARGSKDQRVAEAIERGRASEIARREQAQRRWEQSRQSGTTLCGEQHERMATNRA